MVEVAPKRSSSSSSSSACAGSVHKRKTASVESNQVLEFLLGQSTALPLASATPTRSLEAREAPREIPLGMASTASFRGGDDETSSMSSITSAQSTCSSSTSHVHMVSASDYAVAKPSRHDELPPSVLPPPSQQQHQQQHEKSEEEEEEEEEAPQDKDTTDQAVATKTNEPSDLITDELLQLPALEPVSDEEVEQEGEWHPRPATPRNVLECTCSQPEEEVMPPERVDTVGAKSQDNDSHHQPQPRTACMNSLQRIRASQWMTAILEQIQTAWLHVLEWWHQTRRRCALVRHSPIKDMLVDLAIRVLQWIQHQRLRHQQRQMEQRQNEYAGIKPKGPNEQEPSKNQVKLDKQKPSPINSQQTAAIQEPQQLEQHHSTMEQNLEQDMTSSPPQMQDYVSIGGFTLFLVGYLLACCYRFANPVVEPLPDLQTLIQPSDFSQFRVRIHDPANFSVVHAPFTTLNWEIVGFPMELLEQRGPHMVQYQLHLGDSVQDSEVAILSTAMPTRSFSHKLRIDAPTAVQSSEPSPWVAQLDVIVPVFGQAEKLVVSERVFFNVANPTEPLTPEETKFRIVTPSNGTVVSPNSSFVVHLAYDALAENQVNVTVDSMWRFRTSSLSSPSFVMHALGAGWHTIQVEGQDITGTVHTDQVCIQVQDQQSGSELAKVSESSG